MARRRTRTATKIVRVPAARSAAPIIKVQAPRAPAVRHRRRSRRRSGSRSVLGGIGPSQSRVAMAVGGALFGFAVKQGWVQKLPAIPIVGRTGTAALLLDFWARRGGGSIVHNCATAAAVLAGYQLGSTGAITGDEHFATAGDFQTTGDEDYDGYGPTFTEGAGDYDNADPADDLG